MKTLHKKRKPYQKGKGSRVKCGICKKFVRYGIDAVWGGGIYPYICDLCAHVKRSPSGEATLVIKS